MSNPTNNALKKKGLSKKQLIILLSVIAFVLVAALITTLCVVFYTEGPFIGTVVDAEGNPMADISVTDGRNVVKTNANGEFELRGYRKTRFITVTTPSGYYSNDFYIKTEKSKKSYDFVLTKYNANVGENGEHTFLQITDTEINNNSNVDPWLNKLKEDVVSEKAAFLVHTGDICYEEGLNRHKTIMNNDTMGIPVHYVIGNHDYVKGKYGEALYESIYGPVWYSFEVGNVHYVVTPFQDGSDYLSGYGSNERWRWLANDLANVKEGMQVVIFNHTTSPSDDYVVKYGTKKLDLKEHNLKAWVFGHYHFDFVNEKHGVVNISTSRPDAGGIDSSVSSTRVVSFDAEGNLSTRSIFFNYDIYNAPLPTETGAKFSTQLNGSVLYSDLVVEDNVIYVGTVDDNYPRKCGVYALDATDGSIKWYYETKNSIKNKVLKINNAIIAQDAEGNVYCIDASAGSLIWQKTANIEAYSLNTSSGITHDSNNVYVGNSSRVSALKITTGEEVWSCKGEGENSPAEFVVVGNKLIVSAHWRSLICIDTATGKKLWTCKDEGIGSSRCSTPLALDENTLIVADSNAIWKVDINSGKVTLKKDCGEEYLFTSSGQPCVYGDSIFIPSTNKSVVEVNKDSLEIIRTYASGTALIYSSQYASGEISTVHTNPFIVDGKLYFGGTDGYVYVYNVGDNTNPTKYQVNAPIFANIVLSGNKIYVGDFAGRVSMFVIE